MDALNMNGVRSGQGVFIGVVTVLLAATAGCTVVRDDPLPTVPESVPEGLGTFYTQEPAWGSCAELGGRSEPLAPAAECTTVTVPVDYAQPAAGTAQIALARIKAKGERIGSLLVNPGGPGMSGLATVTLGGGTPLAERFDVVGFDPRGVGASTPRITCATPAEIDADRAESPLINTPEGIAEAEAESREYAARCTERTGAEFLAHVGTREVVRDMDVIRAVLGDKKLSYLGYSYGTRLGAAYAEEFSDKVRAMVLDGAIDPDQDPVAESLRQAEGFQRAFDAFVADCVRQPECPLGTDPARALPRFRALVDPLWEQPAATSDQRGLSYDDAMIGVQQSLYGPGYWPMLIRGLTELGEGRGDTLLQLADVYNGRRPDGSYRNLTAAFNAIRCVDDPRVTDRATMGRQDAAYRQAAPFLDDGRGTGAAPLELCALWPVPNTRDPHRIAATDLPKVVVVSSTGDPATPYAAGVRLAQQLDAALITFEGDTHTVALNGGSPCVDQAVITYFTELTPPSPGLRC